MNNKTLNNKTILITGGTSGIGFELATHLVKQNEVIVLGRNKERLRELNDLGIHTICCNLLDVRGIEQSVLEIEKNYQNLDVLINNAGVQYNYDFLDSIIPISKIQDEITVNLTSLIILTHWLIPALSTSPNPTIVNVTSGLAYTAKNDALVYCASKAGIKNFHDGLKHYLKSSNFKLVEFIPPVTNTNMTSMRDEKKMDTKKLIDLFIRDFNKGKEIITVKQIKLFIYLSRLFPSLSAKILNRTK